MADLPRLLILLALTGVAVTLLCALVIWFRDEIRRTRRGLKVMLKGDLHGVLVAKGRGRGVGFNFTENVVACSWDQGAWGLVYHLDELIGAEAIADGQVVARVHRGETRRALDSLGGAEDRVALRLVFNDLTHPEFVLDLWLPTDETRRDGFGPEEALEECNRWLARIEALFRRPVSRRTAPVVATPPAPAPAMVAPLAPLPTFLTDADDEDQDEDEDEDEEHKALS
jgi:hypothetical protein